MLGMGKQRPQFIDTKKNFVFDQCAVAVPLTLCDLFAVVEWLYHSDGMQCCRVSYDIFRKAAATSERRGTQQSITTPNVYVSL